MSYNPYNIIINNNNNNSQQQQPQPPLPPFGSTIQPTPSPLPPQGLPGPLPVTYPMMPPYGMMPGIPLIPNPPMAAYPTLPPPSGFPGFPTPGSSILMQQQQHHQQQPQAFGSQPGVPGGVMAPEQQLQQYLASANPISSMMKSEGHQLSGIANSSRSDGMKEIDVQHRSTPSDGSGQHVKTDPDKHDASRSSQGETEKEDPTNAKPVFKELSLDDLVAPPGPACVLDDPKLKAAYDYCDTTTAAVIDVAIRQATALCERGIEEQFEVAEAELRVALIEAEMEAYKSGMTVSKDSNDIENKRRRVAIYGGTLSPNTQSQQHEQGSPESPDANVWGGGLSAGLGSRNNSPGATSLHSADQETAHKPSLPPRFGGGVRHHRRAPTSTTANVGNLENGGSAAASPPSSSISTDSSPAE